jgi:hypothetical protein
VTTHKCDDDYHHHPTTTPPLLSHLPTTSLKLTTTTTHPLHALLGPTTTYPWPYPPDHLLWTTSWLFIYLLKEFWIWIKKWALTCLKHIKPMTFENGWSVKWFRRKLNNEWVWQRAMGPACKGPELGKEPDTWQVYCIIMNILSPMHDCDMPDKIFILSVPIVTCDMINISSDCDPDTCCLT